MNYIRSTSNDWEREKHNLLGAYHNRLQDPDARLDAATAFVSYELSISHLHKNEARITDVIQTPEILVPFAALEVHYMLNGGFMQRGQLLNNIQTIKNHRIHIVHGRNDAVCLPRAAARLYNALRGAGAQENVTLQFVEAAGHSNQEPPIARALRTATDAMANEPSPPSNPTISRSKKWMK